MDQRVSLITLGVEDLDASRSLYERLGWIRKVSAAPGVAFFQAAGGMALSLFPRGDLAVDSGVEAGAKPGFAGVTLAQIMRSKEAVDALMREAEGAGATIVKPPQEAFWGGYHGFFADLDGYIWEIAWNPGFGMAEDGGTILPD